MNAIPVRRGFSLFVLFLIALPASASVFTVGSASAPTGTTVQIPLLLSEPTPSIQNMLFTLNYDPAILEPVGILRGNLTMGSLFDITMTPGKVRLGILSEKGVEGPGSFVFVVFRVIGTSGISPLRISDLMILTSIPTESSDQLTYTTSPGTVTVIRGLRFDTRGQEQFVSVDTSLSGNNIRVKDNQILYTGGPETITITTRGLSSDGQLLTGVVDGVTLSSAPVTADLSFGRVDGYFDVSFPQYPTDCSFSIDFTEITDPATRALFEEAAARQDIEIEAIPYLANVTTCGCDRTGPVTGHFTVPQSLVQSLGGIDRLWFGHTSEFVAPELLKAELEKADAGGGRVTVKFLSPEGLSIFGMVSAKIKAAANVEEAVTTPSGVIFFGPLVMTISDFTTNTLQGVLIIAGVIGVCIVSILLFRRDRGY
jgi:hypothetical protein